MVRIVARTAVVDHQRRRLGSVVLVVERILGRIGVVFEVNGTLAQATLERIENGGEAHDGSPAAAAVAVRALAA